MSDEIDVQEESSSSEQTQQPEAEAPAESTEPVEKAESAKEDNVPFHMHPRFKEIVEQKNKFAEESKQFQSKLAELERRFQDSQRAQEAAKPKPVDPLMERLKGIDPEFANAFGKINKLDEVQQQLESFKHWQQAQEAQKTQLEARSSLEKLYTDNKVAPELRELYENSLIAASNKDPSLTPKDLPRVFKTIHEGMSKLFDKAQREKLASYVETKSKDASTPQPQSKGKMVKPGKPEYSKDPYEARSQLVQQILKEAKASKDI